MLGHLHQTEGLAVAFGVGAAEIAAKVLLGVPALLLADDHDRATLEEGRPADGGLVVHEQAVTMELLEVVEEHPDVIEGVGAAGVARQLDPLPGVEVAVDLPAGLLELGLEGA